MQVCIERLYHKQWLARAWQFIVVITDSTEPGSSREDTALPDENSSFIEIRKLQPFTNYTMYVRMWNKFGGSIQSTTVQCSTAASGTGKNDAKLYITNKLGIDNFIVKNKPKLLVILTIF